MTAKRKRKTSTDRRAKMLDEIKDEIDRLADVKSDKHREQMANELVEYLQLHHGARPGL